MKRRLLSSRIARGALGASLAVAVALSSQMVAFAHVTLRPQDVAAGSTVDFEVRVPNEKSNADTTKIELSIPGAAESTVSGGSVSGWTATVDRTSATEVKVVWTGGKIAPNASLNFPLTLSVPPDKAELIVPVLQTYSDGDVVRWIDRPLQGQPEPAHPAALVRVSGAVTTTTTPAVATTAPAPGPASTDAPAMSDEKAKKSGIAMSPGLVLIAAGIVLALFVYFRTRSHNKQ